MNTNRNRIALAASSIALGVGIVTASLTFGTVQAAVADAARVEVQRVTAERDAAIEQADAAEVAYAALSAKQDAAIEDAFDRGFGAGVEYQEWFQK